MAIQDKPGRRCKPHWQTSGLSNPLSLDPHIQLLEIRAIRTRQTRVGNPVSTLKFRLNTLHEKVALRCGKGRPTVLLRSLHTICVVEGCALLPSSSDGPRSQLTYMLGSTADAQRPRPTGFDSLISLLKRNWLQYSSTLVRALRS